MVFVTFVADVSQRALLSGIPISGEWSFGKQGMIPLFTDILIRYMFYLNFDNHLLLLLLLLRIIKIVHST